LVIINNLGVGISQEIRSTMTVKTRQEKHILEVYLLKKLLLYQINY